MIAVVALTKEAAQLGEKVVSILPRARLWVQNRHKNEFPKAQVMSNGFSRFVADCWEEYSQFIFIMASGIVVRTIAPLLKNKARDPGIVVMDEKGGFAISLVSGHLGGANALARKLGDKMGCIPVITTASDVKGVPALDDLARENCFSIENLRDLKKIAANMLEGNPISLYSSIDVKVDFPSNVKIVAKEDAVFQEEIEGIIFVTEKEIEMYSKRGYPYVVLRPPNIIAGIGCRKGKSADEIIHALISVLKKYKISPASLAHIATVDVKKEEGGLIEAAKALKVPFKWVSREEVKKASEPFEKSDFVKKQIGVGAVAEPAAWLTAEKPRWISRKTRHDGITVALVKDWGVSLEERAHKKGE